MIDYFTSDWHCYHDNGTERSIIDYCNRPFKNTDTMHNHIINNINDVVTDEDTLHVLGDITLKAPWFRLQMESLVAKMKGRKILIFGNHDRMRWDTYLEIGFESVHSYLYLPEYDWHLVHDPAVAQDDSKKWITGHVHNLYKTLNHNIINVGVDVWDFKPVSAEEIAALFKEMEAKK